LAAEAKDEVKKRIQSSPDRADALVMGLYALSWVGTFENEERVEAEGDRQGTGKKGEWQNDVSEDFDYSGYNL
jgi:hypothetical protein